MSVSLPFLTRLNHWRYAEQPAVRRLTRASYELLSAFDRDVQVRFLNCGFTELAPGQPRLTLAAEDERYRDEIQLYDHLARRVTCNGRDALEVSAGRGGGADYLMRRYRPRSLTGVDLSQRAVDFCRRGCAAPGLGFRQGDAKKLDHPNQSFDLIVKLEAAFHLPHTGCFFRHAVRLLRPGGWCLYADRRFVEELPARQAQRRHLEGLAPGAPRVYRSHLFQAPPARTRSPEA